MRVINSITIEDREIDIRAQRSRGPGGQNVNKVATAIQLRFDIRASSLPDICKKRLLALHDKRITKDGVIVIKAQQYRSQDKNRQDALDRLKAIVQGVMKTRKVRRATRPTSSSKENRLEGKARRSRIKRLRKKVDEE